MSNTIIPKPTMIEAGQVANHYAARNLFDDYQRRKSRNTLRALVADLSHPRMAIRVAAQHALTDLAVGPFIHKSPVIYNSKGSEASWRLSQSAWKRLVDEGKIPGKPAGP